MEEFRSPGEVEVRQSAGSKRVTAPRPLATAGSAAHRLLHREVAGAQASRASDRWRAFSHFQLQREWDLYAHDSSHNHWPPFYLRRRSAVREVLAAQGLVIALADSGVCTAFDQETGEPLCFINIEADEVIRSLFINELNGTLITISVYSGDAFQSLKVRATPLGCLRARRPDCWRALFTSEQLRWPGFIELDDINDVIVTCDAFSRQYKLWDLRAPYHPRFHVSSQGVKDAKVCQGALMLLMQPQGPNELPLCLLDLKDGTCVQKMRIVMRRDENSGSAGPGSSSPGDSNDGSSSGGVSSPTGGGGGGGEGPSYTFTGGTAVGSGSGTMELVELFGRHLLTKEEGGPLHITDVATGAVRVVSASVFPAPSAFIYLPFNHAFLAFWETGDAQLWNFHGERLATLAGAALPSASSSNTVFVSNPQDIMFVYSKLGGNGGGSPSAAAAETAAADAATGTGSTQQQQPEGCIRVFDLLTGRQVATVQHHQQQQAGGAGRKESRMQARAAAALQQVTALYYDETCHRLYTGTADGKVQEWGT